jgi:hypothetical protein
MPTVLTRFRSARSKLIKCLLLHRDLMICRVPDALNVVEGVFVIVQLGTCLGILVK